MTQIPYNPSLKPHLVTGAVGLLVAGLLVGLSPSVKQWTSKGQYKVSNTEKAVEMFIGLSLAFGLSSFVENPLHRINRRENAVLDITDQTLAQGQYTLEVSQYDNTLLPQVENSTEKEYPSMSWNQFVQDILWNPVEYPHIGVFGRTGAGKTLTLEVCADMRAQHFVEEGEMSPTKVYVSPTCKDNEFLGWELVGKGFNGQNIANYSTELVKQLQDAFSTEKHSPVLVAIDEHRWINNHTEGVTDNFTEILDMGRKEQFNAFICATSYLVKTLGLEGEGDIRDNMVMILKGELIVKRASQMEREKITEPGFVAYTAKFLEQHGVRAAMVHDKLMLLPDMSSYRGQKQRAGLKHKLIETDKIPPVQNQNRVLR